MKPLYLEDRIGTSVHLEEPALVVRREDEADRLFPLERIGRIISHENVRWTQEALLAVARRGIPMVFHDSEGAVVVRLLGKSGEPGRLVRQLEELLATAYGAQRYQDWCAHAEREILLAIRSGHVWLSAAGDEERLRRALFDALSESMQADLAAISLNYIENRVLAWVTQRLGVLGIGAATPHLTGGVIDLPADLSRLLRWGLLVRWVENSRDPQVRGLSVRRKVTEHFQRLEPTLEEQGRRLLARLHLWSSNPEWR